jgi:hypothetical protein
MFLLNALRGAYLALGSFVTTSLVSIVGAALAAKALHPLDDALIMLGLLVGFVGAGSLVWASVLPFRATRSSMLNISEEAAMVRQRESQRRWQGIGIKAGSPEVAAHWPQRIQS